MILSTVYYANSFNIIPINHTLGIYFHNEGTITVSNQQWKLITYKDISLLKDAFMHDRTILNALDSKIYYGKTYPRLNNISVMMRPHSSTLNQIIRQIQSKFDEIELSTRHFSVLNNYPSRKKRGLIDGLGSIFKSITGNLDSSDGAYYEQCINKLEKDDRELENLMKNQIKITIETIHNFNQTINKLRVDEETFNRDIEVIEKELYNITDTLSFYQAQLKILLTYEQLLESLTYIDSQLTDVISSITFARINILHPSVIKPGELISQLNQISQALSQANLPLIPNTESLPSYLNIIQLEAYQTDRRVVFVLKIPLVESFNYKLLHVFSLPIRDERTKLFHVILNSHKYIAISDNNRHYLTIEDPSKCKLMANKHLLCSNIISHPVSSSSVCEAQLLTNPVSLPPTCQITTIPIEDYNVYELEENTWLVAVSSQLPLTTVCVREATKTQFLQVNSLVQLQPSCTGYIGTTKVIPHDTKTSNTTEIVDIPLIPYDCCDHLPSADQMPKLKPLKISKLNLDELNLAEHQLNEYSEKLDELMKPSFISRHWSTFTWITVITIIISLLIYISCRCCRRKKLGFRSDSSDDGKPYPNLCVKISNFCNAKVAPAARPSIHDPGTEIGSIRYHKPDDEVELYSTNTKRKIVV